MTKDAAINRFSAEIEARAKLSIVPKVEIVPASEDRFTAFVRKIEERAGRLDAMMRDKPSSAAVAYQLGVFLTQLKQDIQTARTP